MNSQTVVQYLSFCTFRMKENKKCKIISLITKWKKKSGARQRVIRILGSEHFFITCGGVAYFFHILILWFSSEGEIHVVFLSHVIILSFSCLLFNFIFLFQCSTYVGCDFRNLNNVELARQYHDIQWLSKILWIKGCSYSLFWGICRYAYLSQISHFRTTEVFCFFLDCFC